MRSFANLWIAVTLIFAGAVGCEKPNHGEPVTQPSVMFRSKSPQVVFLTRDGCVNTPVMRKNLDMAIDSLRQISEYRLVDQGTLGEVDARRGYPTPTILLDGRDLFDQPRPLPPFPAPT
jgi:hypothetical protein